MTLIEAQKLIEVKRDDCRETAENYERIFPGQKSSYRTDIVAYTIAVMAIRKMIEENGENYCVAVLW